VSSFQKGKSSKNKTKRKMSLENSILEKRLICKDSVIGISSLGRCAKALLTLKTSSEETTNANLDAFARELLLFRLEIVKGNKSLQTFEAQKQEYNDIEQGIHQAITGTKEEIAFLNKELMQELEIRKHRLHCEEIATEVNKQNCRSYLKHKMEEISSSIDTTNRTLERLDSEIKIRRNQYDQLLTSLQSLEEKLVFEGDGMHNDVVDDEGEHENFRSDRDGQLHTNDDDKGDGEGESVKDAELEEEGEEIAAGDDPDTMEISEDPKQSNLDDEQ
jgi:prefoldin subunit 5